MTATTVTKAVANREEGPIAVMWSKRSHFNVVLPQHVDVEAFLGTAAGALYGSADLMEAAQVSPDSLITALMRCAALGHQPGTDEFYLTPRKRKGRPEVLGIEGYRGIIERMYRSGAVASVVVREVCAADNFRYAEGADDKPFHSIGGEGRTGADFFGANGSRNRGEMVGVYAYAQLTTGAVSRVVILSRDDVLAARDAGGYRADDKFSPWNRMDGGKDHPEFTGRSMWWKTAARRLEPWVPTSAEYRREQLRAASAASDLAGHRNRPPAAMPTSTPHEVVDADVVDDTPDVSPAGRQVPGPADPSPRAEPAGEARTPAMASTGQVSIIGREMERLGYNPADPDDQDAALNAVADLAGTEISDVNQLTQDQAAEVIRHLKRCDDPAMLAVLLEDGEVPGE